MMRYVVWPVCLQQVISRRLPNGAAGPLLLGYEDQLSTKLQGSQCWRDLPPHRDENQVELDVNRSFIYYPKSTR